MFFFFFLFRTSVQIIFFINLDYFFLFPPTRRFLSFTSLLLHGQSKLNEYEKKSFAGVLRKLETSKDCCVNVARMFLLEKGAFSLIIIISY
jgi:hypothetical protein